MKFLLNLNIIYLGQESKEVVADIAAARKIIEDRIALGIEFSELAIFIEMKELGGLYEFSSKIQSEKSSYNFANLDDFLNSAEENFKLIADNIENSESCSVSVFRFENEDGQGPYCSDQPKMLDIIIGHDGCPTHPSYNRDLGLQEQAQINDSWYFGFDDKNSSEEWFTKSDRKVLNYYGYNLVEYIGPEYLVAFGEYQVMFKKDFFEKKS